LKTPIFGRITYKYQEDSLVRPQAIWMQMKIDSKFFKNDTTVRINAKLIESVQDYLDVTEYLRETFDVEKPWYRGVSHARYDLIPKVYRDRLWQRHENFEWWLHVEFANRARPFVNDHHHYSQWHWYFTMQHYGLPTRLLDWTEGSLIALYFAVREPDNTYIPSVYFMNPYWFDEFVYKKNEGEGIAYNTDDSAITEDHRSRLLSYLGEGETPKYPICIDPPVINSRIHAQKSVFTIHGRLINPFRMLAKNNDKAQIVKIRFSTKKAEHIKQQLDGMGITEGTLFPDLEGLARDMKYERGIE